MEFGLLSGSRPSNSGDENADSLLNIKDREEDMWQRRYASKATRCKKKFIVEWTLLGLAQPKLLCLCDILTFSK